MKKKKSYLKLCNNPYKEKVEKLNRRVAISTIILTVVILIIALIAIFFKIS